MPHIFISHSSDDNDIAEAVCLIFRDNQIDYWIDLERLADKALPWRDRITEGIDPASLIMVLVSPDANSSNWVKEEIIYSQGRNKKFLLVIVAGDTLEHPFGLGQLGHIDLRSGLTPNKDNLTPVAKAQLLGAIRATLATAQPATKSPVPMASTAPDFNPFPVSKVIIVDEVLDKVIHDVRMASKLPWRVSLIWFQGDYWYIAAENGQYKDDEKRLWLKKGQGFAGQCWARHDIPDGYATFYPSIKTLKELSASLNLDDKHAEITRRMRAIVCFPIFNPATELREMVGMLSLDTLQPERSVSSQRYRDLPSETLNEIKLLKEVVTPLADYTALHYQSFWGLRHLLHVSRLLPPLDVSTRAAIYWEHTKTHELYMIVSSEREPTVWSTKSPSYYSNKQPFENTLVYRAWTEGKPQSGEVKHGVSGIALPLQNAEKRIIGVFTLEWDRPMTNDGIDPKGVIGHLVDLAAKVLEARTYPWND